MNYKRFTVYSVLLVIGAGNAFVSNIQAQPLPPREDMKWFEVVDTSKNGNIEIEELTAFSGKVFQKMDRNSDGNVDANERPRNPRPQQPVNGQQDRAQNRPKPIPFFVMEALRRADNIDRGQFERNISEEFRLMDKNSNGAVSMPEAQERFAEVDRRVQNERPLPQAQPLNNQTARFIGAEQRFGDKLVKGVPFSAETVIEDTRRLYDGTTVTKQNKGAVYRDGAGRTRTEQTIDSIGGFNVLGEDKKPQRLIFINDFTSGNHYFLDPNRKVARKNKLQDLRQPFEEQENEPGKKEALGTKTIDGISVEGTRVTREIPAGELGNDKPIQVFTEKWYSTELQVVVLSRHVDPLSGEHIYRLTNIKKGEPSAELFMVPADFRIENQPRPNGRRND